jgi:hypothetical protein
LVFAVLAILVALVIVCSNVSLLHPIETFELRVTLPLAFQEMFPFASEPAPVLKLNQIAGLNLDVSIVPSDLTAKSLKLVPPVVEVCENT